MLAGQCWYTSVISSNIDLCKMKTVTKILLQLLNSWLRHAPCLLRQPSPNFRDVQTARHFSLINIYRNRHRTLRYVPQFIKFASCITKDIYRIEQDFVTEIRYCPFSNYCSTLQIYFVKKISKMCGKFK
jgi:hypothetical protein